MSYQAWHVNGNGACGSLAFTFLRHPGKWTESANVVMPNGASPLPYSRIRCGSCEEVLWLPHKQCELREVAP